MSADAASTSNQRGGTKGKREPNNVVQVTDGDDDATTVKFEALKRRVVGIMGVEAVKRENEDGGVFEAWFQGRCLGTSAGATDEDRSLHRQSRHPLALRRKRRLHRVQLHHRRARRALDRAQVPLRIQSSLARRR
jgi:hypothetical protein